MVLHQWPCLCGGWAYTRDQLIDMSYPDPEDIRWADMWRSVLGPYDFFCVDEDDVLTEAEAWRVRGLTVPVHDEHDPADIFDMRELVA